MTDPQGAVVPGAVVTVRNVDTNVDTLATSDTSGGFIVRQLIPGRYRVTAALPGFKTFTRDGIVLRTAETATIRITLSLGGVEEVVTVTSGLTQVESNETAISQTIENKRITELPLNGRQVYMLLQLTAGTLFTQTTFGATGFSGTRRGTSTGRSPSTAAGPATTSS